MEINDFSDGWKYFSLPMPAHQWREVSVEIRFFDNIGSLYIDGLQLSKNDVSTKRYDNNGNITGVCVSERESTYTYDGYNRIKTMTTPGGVKQTYTYDNKTNNLKSVTADYGPSSYMKYDAYGNQKSLSVHKKNITDENGNTSTEQELYSENSYTDDGNYLKSSTDNAGAKTTYEYDEKSGLLKSEVQPSYGSGRFLVEKGDYPPIRLLDELIDLPFIGNDDSKGVKISYEYDGLDRIEKVSRSDKDNERSVSYRYGAFSDLEAITHNGFEYGYEYDAFGNIKTTTVAGNEISKNEYRDNNGSLILTTYADGASVKSEYDNYGNVAKVMSAKKGEEFTDTDTYEYYNDGNLARHTDVKNSVETEYDYNDKGKISRTRVSGNVEGTDYDSRLQYIYNQMGKVQKLSYEVGQGDKNVLKDYTYTYDKDGNNHENILPDGSVKEYKYDSLRRMSKTIYSPVKKAKPDKQLTTSVTYEAREASGANLKGTTNRVAGYTNQFGKKGNTYNYEYDDKGNIISLGSIDITQKEIDVSQLYKRVYSYNCFGEVVKAEERYDDAIGKQYEYTYEGGNITKETIKWLDKSKDETHTYTYDEVWKDKLISYNDGEKDYDITYDRCGNPLNYLGYEMQWNTINGSLSSIKKDNDEYKYTYFSDGQRLTKNVNGKKTVYIYNAGMLLAEETDNYRINFYYDANGLVTQIGYLEKNNGTYSDERYYFFTRNGQGDIVGIYRNSDSTLVGTYEYDLWGNIVSVKENVISDTDNNTEVTITDTDDILNKNPLRYRGYYYDAETGFYYLNARYYDPKLHRFISADKTSNLGLKEDVKAYNLYAYCENDPINRYDPKGDSSVDVWEIIVEAAKESRNGFYFAGAVSQIDSSLPGPMDLLALSIASVVFVNAVIAQYKKSQTKTIDDTKEKALADAKKLEPQYVAYWPADLINKKVVVYWECPLTWQEASLRVAMLKNLMCVNQAAAKWILFVNGYWNAVGPEKGKGEGYYWHYHPTRKHKGYESVHIWYLN
jgi:RHS repeat-associated protein